MRALLCLLLLSACGANAPATASRPPEPLELTPAQAEVWSPTVLVSGRLRSARGELASCEIERSDRDEPGQSARFQAQVSGVTFSLKLPLPATRHSRARARCRDQAGQTLLSAAIELHSMLEAEPEPPAAALANDRAWIDRAVVYGVIPRLYGEPPLAKLTAALPQLRELGVDALWLSPLFETPPDDFGYAVTDYFEVRRDYGDRAALEALLREAHRLGLRVLLDMVLNHSSSQHRYFREAEALGSRSHYFAFYDRDASGQPTHYFDWTHLPNFNFAEPEVAAWATAFSRYWLKLGVDGYRVDAAWGVRQRAPTFYPEWTAALRAVRPDALLLAEASARDPYYLQHGFDAAYDWSAELGHHAWENVFEPSPGSAQRLAAALAQTARDSPRPERTFRFLNNNDTGARFITRHGEPLTRVATAALLTLPGIPCLYSLDELGAEYEPYSEAAPRIGAHPGLRELHRSLIALRKDTPALHGPGYRLLHVGTHDELLVYLRSAAPGQVALVALNFGASPVSVSLPLPAELSRTARLREALSGRTHAPAAALQLSLPAWGAQLWLPAP